MKSFVNLQNYWKYCNVVNEQPKEYQICATHVESLTFNELATLLTAYNAFSNRTIGETGLIGICSSDNPVIAYAGMITATTLTDPVKMLLMHHAQHVQQEREE